MRELERWGIRESRLPEGSTVMFRSPSVWQAYRWQMLGIAGVVLLQSLLIVGLLTQRRRAPGPKGRWPTTNGV